MIDIKEDITCLNKDKTKKDMANNSKIFINDTSELDGMIATTNIKKFELIKKKSIRKTFLIIKNAPIYIEYTSPNGIIKIRKRGVALENGSIEDTIRVKTNNSHVERNGIVKDKNIVLITK